MLAATAHAAEVSELNQKLQVADEELDYINKRLEETQGMGKLNIRSDMYSESFNSCYFVIMIIVGAAEVESLKSALAQAKNEAEGSRAATEGVLD